MKGKAIQGNCPPFILAKLYQKKLLKKTRSSQKFFFLLFCLIRVRAGGIPPPATPSMGSRTPYPICGAFPPAPPRESAKKLYKGRDGTGSRLRLRGQVRFTAGQNSGTGPGRGCGFADRSGSRLRLRGQQEKKKGITPTPPTAWEVFWRYSQIFLSLKIFNFSLFFLPFLLSLPHTGGPCLNGSRATFFRSFLIHFPESGHLRPLF